MLVNRGDSGWKPWGRRACVGGGGAAAPQRMELARLSRRPVQSPDPPADLCRTATPYPFSLANLQAIESASIGWGRPSEGHLARLCPSNEFARKRGCGEPGAAG